MTEPGGASSRAPLRVLMVEDSEDDALLVLRELRRGGYEPVHVRVDTPETLEEVLEEALGGGPDGGTPWDVVISDYRMPRFGAPEALEMVRGGGLEAPFILVSGKIGEDAAVELIKAGAYDYVAKGGLGRLCAAVERGLADAGARRERALAEQRLRETETLYHAVLETTGDGVVITDLEGRVVEANPAFCRMHGRTLEELVGTRAQDWTHPEHFKLREKHGPAIEAGGRLQARSVHVRKDGSLFPADVIGRAFTFRGRPHVLGVVRDVTERAQDSELLEQRVAALTRIAAGMTVDRPLEATLDSLATSVVEATRAVACAVVFAEPETRALEVAGSHGLADGYTDALRASWRRGAQSPAITFETREPALVRGGPRRVLSDPLYAPLHPFIREVAWDTVYTAPLVARGEILGSINVYYLPHPEPAEDELTFLGAVADQAAVTAENARLFAAAQDAAALEERQRLARELHDSVSQAFYGIALGANTVRVLLDRGGPPERVAEPLEDVLSLAEAGMAEMRALIFELRPEALESEGLIATLEKQAAALRARHELPVRLAPCDEPDVPLEAKEALYRVAQEALHNAAKHARASKVELELRLEHDACAIALEVSDDGAGFDPAGSFPGHLGVSSMRERAGRLNGTLQIESAPGEGTRVRARIPL